MTVATDGNGAMRSRPRTSVIRTFGDSTHRLLHFALVAALIAAMLTFSTGAIGTPEARAALNGITDFEIDGDTVPNQGGTDWTSADVPRLAVYDDVNWVGPPVGAPVDDLALIQLGCADVNNDTIWQAGQKVDDQPLVGTLGNANAKNDLCQTYTGAEIASNGDLVLYLGFTRREGNGDNSVLLEYNQAPYLPDRVFRTPNDLLLEFNYDGSGFEDINAYVWNGSDWVAETVPADVFEGAVNLSAPGVDAAIFGEVAINLSAADLAPEPQSPTECLNFSNGILYDKQGNSFSANLVDIGAVFSTDVSTCGQVVVQKATVPSGLSGTFPYQFDVPFGTDPGIHHPRLQRHAADS